MESGAPSGPGRLPWSVAIEWLAVLGLAVAFLWRGFIPGWQSLNTDFPDYYLAARLYHQGYPLDQIYDWTWAERQKDHARINRPVVAYALLTPFSLLPVLPLSSLPPLTAKRCWLVANLVLLGLTGLLLRGLTKLGARRVALIMLAAMIPLRTNFLYGQEYVLLLLLLTLATWLYFRERPVASGLVLAVTGALKIYPALLVLFFLRKKQWRGAAALALGSAVLWAGSAALFGFETMRVYVVEVLPWPLRGEGQDPYAPAWNSFSALFHRLFILEPELNPHPLAHLPVAWALLQPLTQGLIFVPFFWLMGSSRSDREKMEWGVFVAMLLLLSTNPASYDFLALILTATLVLGYLARAGRKRAATVVAVLYALVCFPIYRWVPAAPVGWETLLAFPRLWAMTAFWICLLVVTLRCPAPTADGRRRWREATAWVALFVVLVAGAAALNLHHLQHEFDNYSARLASTPGALLAAEPAVEGATVLFTRMTFDGYTTASLAGGPFAFGADSFHPATSPGSEWGWTELASNRSQIARFPLSAAAPAPGDLVVEVEDGEKPAVSFDLRRLAFVRERQGRGELWVKELNLARDHRAVGDEREVSPPNLEVLEAAFDSAGQIIFSARTDSGVGEPRLYIADLNSGRVSPFGPGLPRRFPAASPDGRWLAFSERQGSNWQLELQDLATRATRRLTQADCNSIEPAWTGDEIIYATDCGRGYLLTALARIRVAP